MEKTKSSEDLFMGIDVSTQGCKIVIINFSTKKIDFLEKLNYDDDLKKFDTFNGTRKTEEYGVSESNPLMWIEAIHILFKKLKNDFGKKMEQIKCISVSGQQHGLVTLDSTGNLSRKYSKLWNDFSTAEECEILTKALGLKILFLNFNS